MTGPPLTLVALLCAASGGMQHPDNRLILSLEGSFGSMFKRSSYFFALNLGRFLKYANGAIQDCPGVGVKARYPSDMQLAIRANINHVAGCIRPTTYYRNDFLVRCFV